MSQSFFKLIQSGGTAEVADAVANDPSLAQVRNAHGVSALLWSVYNGQTMIRDFLVAKLKEQGVALDLFEAAAVGDETRIRAILRSEASAVEAHSGDGWTALHLAAAFGTPAAAAALLFAGARADAVSENPQRNQPLHAALALGKNPETVELLLAHGADPNATQAGGFTPIFSAAAANRKALAELLVAHGADPSHANDEGKTPAAFARERDHTAMAEWLEGLSAKQPSAP